MVAKKMQKSTMLAMVLALPLCAEASGTVKAAWFVRDISCKVGTSLAGYGLDDISVAKIDDLQLHGLALDDGSTKTLLMSFDLLGMDADTIRRMRHACAAVLGVDDANVMLTCTHTHRRVLHQLTTGIADKELGTVALFDSATMSPIYVIGNYAAHPLAAHSPGRGGLRITSDFPGFYRRYVASETGAAAMFVSGACGDLVPKDDELGVNAARKVGENLAMASVAALIDIERNSGRFVMDRPRLGACLVTMESRLRGFMV